MLVESTLSSMAAMRGPYRAPELAAAPQAAAPPVSLVTVGRADAGRSAVERYVRRAFWRVHGATVRSFPPTLLALRDRHGRTAGVAGIRAAAGEPLYLEQYLDAPVEVVLGARVGRAIARASVVEIGSLACSNAPSACELLRSLPQWLCDAGFEWVVFTATRRVRELLGIFDAPLLELCAATAQRVAGGADDWGRYYAADPRVMAGFLPDAGCVR